MSKVHDEIESMTDVYLAGGLDKEERHQLEEHAATCEACAAVLRDAKEFDGWVRGSSVASAPPQGLEDRVIANLRKATYRRSPKLIKTLVGAAAVVGLIIFGSVFTGSKEEQGLLQRMTGASGGLYTEFRKPSFESAELNEERRESNVSKFTRGVETQGVGGGAGGDGRWAGKPGAMNADKSINESLKNQAQRPSKDADRRRFADSDAIDHSESAGEDVEADKKGYRDELRKNFEKRPEAPAPVVDDRKIIRNADLHLEVLKYDDAYKAIGEITRAKKGFIAGASTTRLANGKIKATVTLRIPPERFEETLAELGQLGTVRHQAITTSDVTKQYQDLESRLKSKETLVERLKKVLLEGKGTVKELMEVEVQMGATIEAIEQIKGELKYYDNLVGMSTITMQVFEKDLGLPFEYVQTLQSTIAVTADNADGVYAGAQDVILKAGGQVAESRMTRANDDSASGYVKGKVDADKFPAVRDALKNLGQQVDQDTVNQQQTGRGGQGDVAPGATVRKEQAVIDFTVNMPPLWRTRTASILIEASPAETAYQEARKAVTDAKGKILGGSLTDKKDGAVAYVKGQVDEADFNTLVEKLKSLGKVKNATVQQDEPGSETGRTPLLRRKGELMIEIVSPPPLIPEESGIGKVLRETFTHSVASLLWSIEKLFVGIALAGPWIVIAGVVLVIWKRARRKPTQNAA